MPKRVLAWQCDYCGKLKKTELIARRHEKSCIKNPNRKNCIDCKGFSSGECIFRGIRCSSAVSPDCTEYIKKEVN